MSELPSTAGKDVAEAGSDASRSLLIGYAFAATGAILFSSKGIIIKFAYEEGISAETLLALRMLMALPVYLVIGAMSIHGRLKRAEALPGAGLLIRAALVGVMGYWFASYLDFLSLSLISAQFNRLILFTYPLFVVIFGALFFGQAITLRAVLAFAIAYLGIAFIFAGKLTDFGSHVVLGSAFVLGAAMTFGLYQLIAKRPIALIGPRLFTCVAMTAAGTMAVLQFLIVEPVSALAVSPAVLGWSFLLAIGATVIPSFFLNAALQRIPAQANATIGMISPVVTIILAIVLLGEALTGRDVIGTLLVIAGVGWYTLGGRR